tara:strand:- start:2427 stop:3293 length:867 start_codon:yes stop_codon:yes gene_type:complete
MKIIELLLDEENEVSGVDAVSLVSMPAIESSWVALKDQEIKLAKVDEEKRIVMGAALIPNKPIFRRDGEETYYVYFSKDTIRRASELFFQKGNQSNATLEHEMKANNLTVFESWIVEDSEKDKSAIYDLDAPVGSWVISMKIEDDKVWESVKNGLYTGYSIEGYFADKATLSHSQDFKEVEAQTKLDEILSLLDEDKIELYSEVINDEFAIINDRLAYSTQEKAEEMAKTINCEGFHVHNFENKDWFMPCEEHKVEAKKTKSPCWDGYEQKGYQTIKGKRKPNCVKVK